MTATVLHGDCVTVMRGMDADSVDAIVCDPPYNLSFMGRGWDTHASALHFQQWCQEWATEAIRVMKPGGFLLSFGAPRTWHRLAVGIEDAGFEIRENIAWINGAGFPKSRNVTRDLASLPPCACDVPGHLGTVDTALPSGLVGTGIGTETGSVPLARYPAHHAGGVRAEMIAGSPTRGGQLDMDALYVGTVGHRLPEMLGALAVTGNAKGQQIGDIVGRSQVDPETLRDQVMNNDVTDAPAVSTPATISALHSITDGTPALPLVLPLPAPPGGIVSPAKSELVVNGHASLATVDTTVGPVSKLDTTDRTCVDPVPFASHAPDSTAERLRACRVCGGRQGDVPQGIGTALKPAHESIVCARKPLAEPTVAANVLTWGTGGINVDACRIGTSDQLVAGGNKGSLPGDARTGKALGMFQGSPNTYAQNTAGRWPPNVALDDSMAAELDQQSGTSTSPPVGAVTRTKPRHSGSMSGAFDHDPNGMSNGHGDSGGASRFFPVFDVPFKYQAKAPASERPSYVDADGNKHAHATVKPVALMRWLVRLVTPPGGTVLDCFAGSGATGEAAIQEGFNVILIEREAEYLPLVEQRIARTHTTPPAPLTHTRRVDPDPTDDGGLFEVPA
jgi:hypothetical protein